VLFYALLISGDVKPETFTGGTREIEAWLGSIYNDSELVARPEKTYAVTRILDVIYRSATSAEFLNLYRE
jgi:hypothetical protein